MVEAGWLPGLSTFTYLLNNPHKFSQILGKSPYDFNAKNYRKLYSKQVLLCCKKVYEPIRDVWSCLSDAGMKSLYSTYIVNVKKCISYITWHFVNCQMEKNCPNFFSINLLPLSYSWIKRHCRAAILNTHTIVYEKTF
jgi:hypothetical protein